MKILTVEILPNKTIYAKWEEQLYNQNGEVVGFGLPTRRALAPESIHDRNFVENMGGELKAYADIAWGGIPIPSPILPKIDS
jgi:hypothetical protein